MKKITMLSTLPPIKGLSPYTLGLVKELSKHVKINFIGFKSIYPEFMYPGGTKDLSQKKPKIKNLRNKSFLTWYNPISWIKAGLTCEGKVVHAQWWAWPLAPIYLIVLSLAKLNKKKIIMTIHNVKPHEKSFFKNLLNKSVLSLADEYIVHNENNKLLFISESKTKKKIYVIPHGIIEIEKPKENKKQLRKKYDFKQKEKIILFFGTIRPYKGLDLLIKTMKYLQGYKLIIAGKPWESFEKYQNLINKNNLESQIVKMLKFVSNKELAELLTLCDVVIFPYKEFEASSGAAATALPFNKPLVVTNVGGLTEITQKKEFITNPDPYEIAKTVKKLKSNYNFKESEFSWKNIARKTIEVY